MAQTNDQTIYSWSQTPTENQSISGINWYEGMPASLVNNSGRAMMASLAGYVADSTYANTTVTYGATNIQITIQQPLQFLPAGFVVRFAIPSTQGTCPDQPFLCINNLPPAARGNNGNGLPLIYEAFDPVSGNNSLQRCNSSQFSPGSLITAVYRPDLHMWDPTAYGMEQGAEHHLRQDLHGLLQSDPNWQAYKTDGGCFQLIEATGAQSAAGALSLLINRILVGNVSHFDMDTPPTGWLVCDGSSFQNSSYPLLAQKLNNRHGGTATTTNLPDLRQLFIRGIDGAKANSGGDDDKNNLGQVQNQKIGPFSASGTTASTGNGSTTWQTISVLQPGNADGGDGGRGVSAGSWNTKINVLTGAGLQPHTHDFSIKSGGYETRPNNMALLPCIFAGLSNITGALV